ncbi:MAG: sulfite exporter TauE/SafE family protein [Oligoflexia bacterium]|nr:sulfite exporter TauE/SafE family protein [Oligoflexia bacterium]
MILDLATVLLLSLIGSWHCAGMCGAFCAIACENKSLKTTLFYNLGRLFTYFLLTLVSYYSILPIKTVLEQKGIFLLVSVLVFIFILFWFLFKNINSLKILSPLFKLSLKFKNTHLKAFFIGATTTLLPCVWLYAFIAYSSLKQTPTMALSFIFSFWLGTLPALFLVKYFSFKIVNIKKFRSLGFLVLFLAATLQLSLKLEHSQASNHNNNKYYCYPFGKNTETVVP